ncbi:hypothetical protein V6N13_149234 [Hibiscus sabdariffa]|uniref:Uncharacterized protein n=1 Tax=Hibiscus sabdariffa TaxID=183260 RepID=A0ABR2ELP4_9ROSI
MEIASYKSTISTLYDGRPIIMIMVKHELMLLLLCSSDSGWFQSQTILSIAIAPWNHPKIGNIEKIGVEKLHGWTYDETPATRT